jgi:hypothetical protein
VLFLKAGPMDEIIVDFDSFIVDIGIARDVDRLIL